VSYSPQPLPTAVATHVAVLARRLPPTLAGHSFMSEAPDSRAGSTTSAQGRRRVVLVGERRRLNARDGMYILKSLIFTHHAGDCNHTGGCRVEVD
jgi:hypothetical protein